MNDCSIILWIGFCPGKINLSLPMYCHWHQYHVFKLLTTPVYMQLLNRCNENLLCGILNKPVVCISFQEVKSPTSRTFSPSSNILYFFFFFLFSCWLDNFCSLEKWGFQYADTCNKNSPFEMFCASLSTTRW